MDLIRLGDASPAVRDVQGRLEDLGHGLVGDVPGEYGSATLEAVRAFQQARGLVADGIVGPDTWRSLVEAGYAVGDRLLYLTSPMLRGDDVFGRNVAMAARVAGQADGGEILVSEAVRDAVSGCEDIVVDNGRDAELKGFTGSHTLYAVTS